MCGILHISEKGKSRLVPTYMKKGLGGFTNDNGEKFRNFADNPFNAHCGVVLFIFIHWNGDAFSYG